MTGVRGLQIYPVDQPAASSLAPEKAVLTLFPSGNSVSILRWLLNYETLSHVSPNPVIVNW